MNIIDDVFSAEWSLKCMNRFNGGELDIGKDRYGRYDFVDKKLSADIHRALSKKIDIGKFKVSHRFYMNKYWPNSSSIGKHVDGHVTDSMGRKSLYTILVYLNSCEGGHTIIYEKGQGVWPIQDSGDNLHEPTMVQPKTGRVLLMKQDVLHEGIKPLSG